MSRSANSGFIAASGRAPIFAQLHLREEIIAKQSLARGKIVRFTDHVKDNSKKFVDFI
jgi:hypothetical protein